jgi:hypothetical protein
MLTKKLGRWLFFSGIIVMLLLGIGDSSATLPRFIVIPLILLSLLSACAGSIILFIATHKNKI